MDASSFWDNPLVSQVAFRPRQTARRSPDGDAEGSLPVAEGVSLGWRLHKAPSATSGVEAPATSPSCCSRGGAIVCYFHANAEVVDDVEYLLPLFWKAGYSAVLAVDYRGYGWSTGTPTLGTLLQDVEAWTAALPALLQRNGLGDRPLLAYGRSLGAACAIHAAAQNPTMFKAVVVDSGLMDIRALPMVQQMAAMMPQLQSLLLSLPDPLGTLTSVARITCPLLVLHSEADEIVPCAQAHACMRAATTSDKALHTLRGSGHNDILAVHRTLVVGLLKRIADKLAGIVPEAEDAVALSKLSVRELRARLAARGLDGRGCIEKSDFVQLLTQL